MQAKYFKNGIESYLSHIYKTKISFPNLSPSHNSKDSEATLEKVIGILSKYLT